MRLPWRPSDTAAAVAMVVLVVTVCVLVLRTVSIRIRQATVSSNDSDRQWERLRERMGYRGQYDVEGRTDRFRIEGISPGPLQRAGLQDGDVVLLRLGTWRSLLEGSQSRSLPVPVIRGGRRLTLNIIVPVSEPVTGTASGRR